MIYYIWGGRGGDFSNTMKDKVLCAEDCLSYFTSHTQLSLIWISYNNNNYVVLSMAAAIYADEAQLGRNSCLHFALQALQPLLFHV